MWGWVFVGFFSLAVAYFQIFQITCMNKMDHTWIIVYIFKFMKTCVCQPISLDLVSFTCSFTMLKLKPKLFNKGCFGMFCTEICMPCCLYTVASLLELRSNAVRYLYSRKWVWYDLTEQQTEVKFLMTVNHTKRDRYDKLNMPKASRHSCSGFDTKS